MEAIENPLPLLSIIVPVYNVEQYVGATLDALLEQDYPNIEILLINDGSTDSSADICRRYASQDKRIRFFEQENQGLATTRSKGLDYATGELVTFVDSDDVILPGTYPAAIRCLLANTACDQVQFPLHKRVGTPNPLIIVDKREPIYGSKAMLHNWVVDRDISWIVCNKIFKRDMIGDLRFKAGFVFEDNLFVVQLLKRSKGICFSQTGAYLYYYRGGSITNTFTLKNNLDMIRIHIEIAEELEGIKELSEARAHISYMIACDVYANKTPQMRWYSKNNEVSQQGMSFLKGSSLWEIISSRRLPLQRKIKTLGIKIISHIP